MALSLRFIKGSCKLLLLAISACPLRTTVHDSFRMHGLDRAAFEMGCPKERLQLVALNRPLDEAVGGGSQIGVQGCDQRMVYVYVFGAGWVANTQSSESPVPRAPSSR